MNARLPAEKLHRENDDYPSLAPGCPPVSLPAWNYAWNRLQMGRAATGGCLYGGQSTTFWTPTTDRLHLTNGPIGCGLYAQANRPQGVGVAGVDAFSGINLGTDFQEKDVVFGGEKKLAQAVAEADRLFPLHRGMTLLSTCPIALIGDDVDAVAREQAQRLGRPLAAVHCAGFRRGDGIGDTHRTLFRTWRDSAAPALPPGPKDVVLLCREMGGAWRGIVALLEHLGLRVVARWPGGSDTGQISRLGGGRLAVSIDMDYWARQLQRQFGLPWVAADFLGPSATRDSLRTIAAALDDEVHQRAEAVIAQEEASAQALIAACRQRLAGKLYFSFAPLQAANLRVYQDFGIRAGSGLQGWPAKDGSWHHPALPRRYQEMTPTEAEALLHQAQPDLVDGPGQDAAALAKAGFPILDDAGRQALQRAAIGYAGTAMLAAELLRLFDAPVRRLQRAPWLSASAPMGKRRDHTAAQPSVAGR